MMSLTGWRVAVFVGGVVVASAALAGAACDASSPPTDAHSRSTYARVRHRDKRD
jgi:hypothetical protein